MFDEQGSPGMYANLLLSTDGSDVTKKGVKHGLALAKALNAKVTVISVMEPPSPIMWIPTQEDVDRFDRPADNVEAAVRYWLRAAEFALSRSANTEGARYAEMGLLISP
jgi:nucleotide-binding universal stress UspA family protein